MKLTFLLASLFVWVFSCHAIEAEDLLTVKTFQKQHIYFKGGDNQREARIKVSFPDLSAYAETPLKIFMTFKLECPNGNKCDYWDRRGHLSLLDEQEQLFEIFRFVTPYRVARTWTVDMSDWRPLLQGGEKELRLMIDTWVGPGHQQGEGWLVTVDFSYRLLQGEEVAKAIPFKIVPVFTFEKMIYGDANKDTQERLVEVVGVPENDSWSHLSMRTFITGHGQQNTDNCAEFCPKNHTFTFNGETTISKQIWRDDCRNNPTPGQYGTWYYARAGFCPGDQVFPWDQDVNIAKDLVGRSIQIHYHPETYVNTKNTGYNGGSHTEPHYFISTYLFFYKDTTLPR